MTNCILTVSSFLFCSCSDSDYKYQYILKLPDIPSFCYLEMYPENSIDTSQFLTVQLIENDNYYLDPGFTPIYLVFSDKDTLKLKPNSEGIIQIKRKNLDGFRLIVPKSRYPEKKYYIGEPYKTKKVTVVLGRELSLLIPILYSKRELATKEILEITQNISNEKHNDLELFKNKTCYLIYEI